MLVYKRSKRCSASLATTKMSDDSDSIWWLMALSVILAIKSAVIVAIICYSGIGLGPDESQYWTWSQFLDWGYYSKPPGIAWQIWLGTKLFGNTELGVRFLSIIFGILLSLSVFWLARCCQLKPRTSFWAGVVMALTPVGILGSFLAITDGGLVLFWTLACIVIATALSKQQAPNYYLLGFIILCGALFKWPVYLFWVVVFGFWLYSRFLVSSHVLGGIAISVLGLLPSVIWNSGHEWATFRHVGTTVTGGHDAQLLKGNFFEFLGSQIGLLSPILFILLILAFAQLVKERFKLKPGLFFCGATSLGILLLFSVLSIFQKIQGNWCSFVYPMAIVFLCWYACEWLETVWLKVGMAFSVILVALGLSVPYIQSHGILSQYPVPYKLNFFHHNIGWTQLQNALLNAGYQSKENFLFGDKYQTSSILSFYGLEQKRAYFLNLMGTRKNQFSFWPSLAEEQLGRTGYFVLTENSPHLEKNREEIIQRYQKLLERYFEEVHFLGLTSIFDSYGTMKKGAFIFRCVGYNGIEPNESGLY